jgi:valyl-tRNA synthetase
MDPGLSRAVQTVFARMYREGLIYRAERIINWCPRCLTALSDIEVEHADEDGELVSIRYGHGDTQIVVATTRAETMLGDTAVAVHPDDDRYRHLVGREVELPLTGRRIPIVADPHVDPEFGTGAVKVTPAHDPNDFEIAQRHGLPTRTVLDERGVVTEPGPFEGLDRFEARAAVVGALREEGRIVAEQRPYVHAVGHCSRCHTVVEPRLSLQWFVKVATLAAAAAQAVREGRVRIHPAEQEPRVFACVDNMHDWCISRQLWWGHRIPVWYGPDGQVRCVGPDETPPSDPGWEQDPDVLDTWFSSGLWPFSTLGWPADTPELRKYYPTSVLVTGYDILFFWVARMLMFGLYAMDGVEPFRVVVLHGMVRDQFGRKMSKSFGNAVDPMEWMDRYGADALRFTLARGANPGADVPIGEDAVAGSRNFGTKLWNAVRFALMNGATTTGPLPPAEARTAADRWILSRLTEVNQAVDDYYEDFQFAKASDLLYHFTWDEVCDWYVELAKVTLADDGPAADATRRVLGEVLDVLLRMLHPVIPFLTEELWTALTGGRTVVTAPWPQPDPSLVDRDAVAEIERVMRLVTEVRRFRAEQGLPPGRRVPARLAPEPGSDGAGLLGHEPAVRALARLSPPGESFTAGASLLAEGVTVDLDLSGAIDLAAERRRLDKDLAAAHREREQAARKLDNPQFLAKAPAAEVAKVRQRAAEAEATIARLSRQLDRLTQPASVPVDAQGT